eukprot:superscaffoldBa00000935_g8080
MHPAGINKKVEGITEEKGCERVKKWQASIKNHLYWSAANSSSGGETVAKWTSRMVMCMKIPCSLPACMALPRHLKVAEAKYPTGCWRMDHYSSSLPAMLHMKSISHTASLSTNEDGEEATLVGQMMTCKADTEAKQLGRRRVCWTKEDGQPCRNCERWLHNSSLHCSFQPSNISNQVQAVLPQGLQTPNILLLLQVSFLISHSSLGLCPSADPQASLHQVPLGQLLTYLDLRYSLRRQPQEAYPPCPATV